MDKPPVYDRCEFCGRPIRPGERHGVVGSNAEGQPAVTCQIVRIVQTEKQALTNLRYLEGDPK